MSIASWLTENIFDSKNKERAGGRQVDPNAYNYGGSANGAEDAANGYTNQGANAQARQATQAQQVGVNYNQANQDRALGQQARQGQASLAQVMQQRATGGAPSVAQQQADRQMGQLASQQASMAGSARGAGGLAAAQRNAAFNTANGAADISGQAQIAAGQERRDDTNAAAGMYANLRGGDLASQGQSANQAQFSTQNATQQNQFNAGLRDSQAARNDAYQMNYDQMANGVRQTQLAAHMNQQAQQSANDLGAQGINAGVGGQNAAMNRASADAALGLGQSVAGFAAGAAGGGAKAKGGPVGDGKPYLVGEQGPELVVPQKDGYVLTAGQTQQALAGSPADTITQLFERGHSATRGASLASVLRGSPARADGGPVDAGGERDAVGAGAMPPSAASPPGYTPPMVTWGAPPDPTGSSWGSAQAQNDRMQPYDELDAAIKAQRAGIDTTAARVGETVDGIDKRDKAAVWNADYKERHGQSMSRTEEDASTEARFRQSEDNKAKRGDAKKQRQRSLADLLSGNDRREQPTSGIDTSYHGGGGHYVPPQLIQISGARAGGGPMMAGGLVPMGPMMGGGGVGGGIELGPGGGITQSDLLRAGTGLASPQPVQGMVGGGGITGGSSMGGHAIPGMAGAREDGGPIEAGGGKGYDTQLSPDEEQAYAAWKQQYAPNDSGGDYDLRGAYKAGEAPGADGHWTDRFKKPNHPTFSNESQYARGNDAARAGRWEGDRFVPPEPPTRQEKITTQTKRDGKSLGTLAELIGLIAPAAAPIAASQALGVTASGGVMSAEDAAARKARQEQSDMDRERNELNARDRQQAVTPQPAPAALNKTDEETQRRITGRTGNEPAWRNQRSLWDILRGK